MISIQGIKVPNVNITVNADGVPKIDGNYNLMASNGKVVAKQPFGSYNMEISHSKETLQALDTFLASLSKDINSTLGIGE